MKLRKRIVLVAAMISALLLSGCQDDLRTLVPLDDLEAVYAGRWVTEVAKKVPLENMEFAESCFTDIEVMGAHLAVPMYVADLPESFTLAEGRTDAPYRGYSLTSAVLWVDDILVANVEILHNVDEPYENGVIVSMEFSCFLLLKNRANVQLGGRNPFFTEAEANELLGENVAQSLYGMRYDLGNGRMIELVYMGYYVQDGCPEEMRAYSVRLSVIRGEVLS